MWWCAAIRLLQLFFQKDVSNGGSKNTALQYELVTQVMPRACLLLCLRFLFTHMTTASKQEDIQLMQDSNKAMNARLQRFFITYEGGWSNHTKK